MNFEKCTLVELRQLAKEKGIKNVSKLKKDELITILSNNKNETETVKNADKVEAQSVQLNTEKKKWNQNTITTTVDTKLQTQMTK